VPTVTVVQANETDSAQPIIHHKMMVVGQATEADTARAIAVLRSARVAQAYMEVLRDADSPVRVSQAYMEVLRDADSPVRVGLLYMEVLLDDTIATRRKSFFQGQVT